MRVASVLLAAGAGSRFRTHSGDSHKLLAVLNGRTIVERAYSTMREGSPADAPLIVVSGSVKLPPLPDSFSVENPRWAVGQSTSLWAAIETADLLGCDGVVVGLGDAPGLTPETWSNLHYKMVNGASIAVATFEGRRGNPVGLARSVWPLLPKETDEGARSVIAARPDLVIEVACSGVPADIDTKEDLEKWHLS